MKKTIVAFCLSVIVFIITAGCSSRPVTEKDFVGTYQGESGSVLELSDDGTIRYQESDGSEPGKGPWSYSSGKLSIMPTNLGYEIYAEIAPESDTVPELQFRSNHKSWTDEKFTKKS